MAGDLGHEDRQDILKNESHGPFWKFLELLQKPSYILRVPMENDNKTHEHLEDATQTPYQYSKVKEVQ